MQQDFDDLYQCHAAELYRYLRRLTGARMTAQDILQEAFFKLHLQLSAARALTNARAWLFQVATNLAHNRRRDEMRASQREERYEFSPKVVDFHQQLEQQQLLQRALQNLTPQMRQVLLLAAEGFTHREIAEITGIAAGYVAVLIGRGRAAFKHSYQQNDRSSDEKHG